MGYSGLYGPGINMHRTAYSGRNFEYYAEDPFIAGTICAAEVQGIQSKGVYVYLKHVALNDSETSRRGVNTWLNEHQREIFTCDDYADFELILRPTYDFCMELLKVGNMIEVIEPESLPCNCRNNRKPSHLFRLIHRRDQ